MAARGNITLTDGATTPVAHVFYPITKKGEVLFWVDRTATSVPIGQDQLSLLQRVPGKQAKSYKFSWKLQKKTLEQTSPSTTTGIQPQPTLAYENIAAIDIVCHERSSLQERRDLLTQVRDLIDEAITTAQVESLDLIY